MIGEREGGEREREREERDLMFHWLMHSLVDSCVCPDWGSNPQPRHAGMVLWPTELPSQGLILMWSFFGETWNHPADSALLQPRFGTLWLLFFPKTKITFEREKISDHRWHSRKYDGAADGDWENCVRSQGAYFGGDWGVIVLCTMFLVSYTFFSRCLYFSYYMARYLLDQPHIF